MLQIARGTSVPSFADGVEGLFQSGVIAIVVSVRLDGAKAIDPEVFSAFE